MSHIRVAGIPIDHLAAEVAAFPLASEAALQIGLTELSPWMAGKGAGEKRLFRLWRETERALSDHAPNVSLDELVAIRDRTWFRPAADNPLGKPQPLGSYLRRVAKRHLEVHGPDASPSLQVDHADDGLVRDPFDIRSREAWRWLSFALPPDLLVAALDEDGRRPLRVETLSPQLASCLREEGFAESHLHVGAGLDFSLLWASAMCALGDTGLASTAFQSPGAAFDEGRQFGDWLLRAAIVRYFLAAFLHAPSSVLNLEQFAAECSQELLDQVGPFGLLAFKTAVGDLIDGTLSDTVTYANLKMLYVQITGASPLNFPRRKPPSPIPRTPDDRPQLEAAFGADPIAAFFPPTGSDGATPEMRFLAAGLRYLDPPESGAKVDEAFARLFWQVVRVRNLFYRHVVQRPMTPGLQWFVRTYGRLSAGRRSIKPGLQLESAAITSGLGNGLRALEIRTSPEASWSDLRQLVEELDEHFQLLLASRRQSNENRPQVSFDPCAQRCDPCEFGIVFHIAKQRGGGISGGAPNGFWLGSNADPSTELAAAMDGQEAINPTGYRYAKYYQADVRPQAMSLARLLLSYPLSLAVVRGIDVCTDELGVPTWVMVPVFRYLREVSGFVSAWLKSAKGLDVPPLRTTVHAGEDFVHLLTGLRNVDASIRYLGLRQGDRIGHGVALGVHATRWAKTAGRVAMMREERLIDLIWEWQCYSVDQLPVPQNRWAHLCQELARLSQELFGKPIEPLVLKTWLEMLHSERELARAGFPYGKKSLASGEKPEDEKTTRAATRLLRKYLTSADVFRRGRVLEWLDPASEAASLERLQDHLRRRVAKLGLAVEVNPSSNLLIANLGGLRSHPLWRLKPPVPGPKVHPVDVVIGSDDPLTFATNLRQEYALLHDALIGHPAVSDSQANAWLTDVRAQGMRFRFTMPRPAGLLTDILGPVDADGIEEPP